MPQHLRTGRTLGTLGALTLWASGGVIGLGFWDAQFFLFGVVAAGVGVALLRGERAVARRNLHERLGHDRHRA